MKKFLTTLIVVMAIVSFATSAMSASSKFAAHVSQAGEGKHLLHSGIAKAELSGVPAEVDNEDNILTVNIKTANKKDLLIGVSLESSIYTETKVKGKNGSAEIAGAEAGIFVRVEIDGKNNLAFPSYVIFNKRVLELTATLGGVIESCQTTLVDEDGDMIPDSGEIIVARDCVVTEEEIGLMLSTTSANHFNFVAPDMTPGEHTVKVYARAMSSAEFLNGIYPIYDLEGNLIGYESTSNNEAEAWALVGVGSLTVEEVRAINQEDGIIINTDAGY